MLRRAAKLESLRFICALTLASMLTGAIALAHAQDAYPSKAVVLINPYGSLSPGVAPAFRLLASVLSERFGQQFVIEQRGGADGAIGMDAVAKAAPDGYTLSLTNVSPTTVLQFIRKDVPFDGARDFAPVGMIGRGESFILAGPSLKAKDLAELLRVAKENPEKVTFAIVGAIQRLNVAKLQAATGTRFLVVPYAGGGQAEAALLGGHVDLFSTSGNPKALSRGGAIRLIATNNPTRSSHSPDVPAVAEFAPGYESRAWHGILAPAGTPDDRIRTLNSAINTALQQPRMRDVLLSIGIDPAPITAEAFAAAIRADLQKNAALVKQYNITAD